jgi:GWxTD domain-containing protein
MHLSRLRCPTLIARATARRIGVPLLSLSSLVAAVSVRVGAVQVTEATYRAAAASPAAAADSIAAAGDTAAALALLDERIHRHTRDAAAWHRRGLYAWALSREARKKAFVRDGDDIRRLIRADTSLQRAVQLAPDSARYALDLARFYRSSGTSIMRFTAERWFHRAEDAARRAGDSLLLAEALDQIGMISWRRYESVADRYALPGLAQPQFAAYVWDEKALRDYVETRAMPIGEGESGDLDYLQATDAFAEALRLHPSHPAALRHALMGLAARNRWEELRELALRRLSAAPWDPWAWLARGLGSHRLNDARDAAAAFDSAMTYLDPRDAERLTRISRVLRPTPQRGRALSDSALIANSHAARRARFERLYWTVSDPLAMTGENEHRLEFLARVVFADLRWSAEELDVRGADTERGDIYIRYGPPDRVYSFAPELGVGLALWTWGEHLSFVFRQPSAFGTGTLDGDFAAKAQAARERIPVRFDNIDLVRRLDTIPAQVTRFRAAGDSTDFLLFALVPLDSLTKSLDVVRSAVDVEFRLYDEDAVVIRRDSSRVPVEIAALPAEQAVRAWRGRVGRDAQLWRVEAWEPTGRRAARASGLVTHDTSAGFGTSDLLVARRILPRDGALARRWGDFNIVPSAGVFSAGQPVALLWETYGLATDSTGSSRYRVAVTLAKVQRTGALGLAARIVDGVGDAVGRSAEGRGSVTLRFDRSVAARPAQVDYLTLELGRAAPGRYVVRVEITDLVSGRVTKAERQLRVED